MIEDMDRRRFFSQAGLLVAATGLNQTALAGWAAVAKEEDVSPVEDLMREHGLLNRVLLIYDHCSERLQNRQDVDLKALADAREIIRNFVEAYHEKLEEEHLFPRFEKAKKLTGLVAVLRQQHVAGRQVTAEIEIALQKKDHVHLITYLHAFTRMYRPHEAREDTILFPAFQSLVSKKEYKELGELFESREHQLFGKEGFEGQVDRVGEIERRLGIYDLSQFTPKVS
jgi:hemerythrin-like domain-containing protein